MWHASERVPNFFCKKRYGIGDLPRESTVMIDSNIASAAFEKHEDLPQADRMEGDSRALSAYLDRIGRVKLLEPADELRLSKAARAGDDKAAKALAEANLRLVVHVATRYSQKGVALRDLIAAGNMGLMRAVQTFEARPDSRFANYAVWWIRRHMLRALMEEGRSARLPLHRLPLLSAVRRERTAYMEKTGREPSAGELAEILGVAPAKVLSLLAVARRPSSLNAPVGSDPASEATLGDFIADDEAPDPVAKCLGSASATDIKRLLERLTPREADVLRQRYGLDDGEPRTCEEIGRRYGLTRERVRQIQDKALRRLRNEYEELSRPRTKEERLAEKVSQARETVIAEFARKTREKQAAVRRKSFTVGEAKTSRATAKAAA